MSASQIREPATFGKRTEPHTIVITRNGKSSQFTVKPVYFSVLLCLGFMFMVGYFGATAYLVFRDDLLGASFARQARIQHQYEDRIAALRSKLDRVTSRQLLDQRAIETRVQELMNRQASIGSRNGRMSNLLNKAKKRGLNGAITLNVPVPKTSPAKASVETKPLKTSKLSILTPPASTQFASVLGAGTATAVDKINRTNRPSLNTKFTEEIFGDVADAIGAIDSNQRDQIDRMRIDAASRSVKIAKLLNTVGVSVPETFKSDIGGPFVPLDHSVKFELHLHALEASLQHYDSVKNVARTLPLETPIPGAKISSRYGSRIDPFNGRVAMHGGMDFKASSGTAVRASGAGKVVKAGRLGGYGKIVEIRHRNGYTTRYAHLSRITVKVGDTVTAGERVGKVGSTGRSTGPHLHYEIRKGDKTINPSKFITAGYKLRGLL